MHGVTTALIAFIFVCLIFPHLVKNRTQFYVGLMLTLTVMLFDGLGQMFPGGGFAKFCNGMAIVFQMVSVFILFLCAGGLTWSELGGEMKNAIEVIRRGEEEKEIIIPLTGQKPKARDETDEEPPQRVEINDPRPPAKPESSSLPLE
jgi:hypothetical protein